MRPWQHTFEALAGARELPTLAAHVGRLLTPRAVFPSLQIMSHDIEYSEKYADDDYEYRCVSPGLACGCACTCQLCGHSGLR